MTSSRNCGDRLYLTKAAAAWRRVSIFTRHLPQHFTSIASFASSRLAHRFPFDATLRASSDTTMLPQARPFTA
jgi:hypothetical protein